MFDTQRVVGFILQGFVHPFHTRDVQCIKGCIVFRLRTNGLLSASTATGRPASRRWTLFRQTCTPPTPRPRHRARLGSSRLFGADICERYFKLFIRGDEPLEWKDGIQMGRVCNGPVERAG